MAKQPDIQVLIPYKTLCELLEASKEVIKLRQDVKRLSDEQDRLRSQFVELMDAFGDLKDYVTDSNFAPLILQKSLEFSNL